MIYIVRYANLMRKITSDIIAHLHLTNKYPGTALQGA